MLLPNILFICDSPHFMLCEYYPTYLYTTSLRGALFPNNTTTANQIQQRTVAFHYSLLQVDARYKQDEEVNTLHTPHTHLYVIPREWWLMHLAEHGKYIGVVCGVCVCVTWTTIVDGARQSRPPTDLWKLSCAETTLRCINTFGSVRWIWNVITTYVRVVWTLYIRVYIRMAWSSYIHIISPPLIRLEIVWLDRSLVFDKELDYFNMKKNC